MGMKCGINGCKKLKVQPHTHVMGSMGADPQTIENYRIWSQLRGEPFNIPGGDGNEQMRYMTNRMGAASKDAKKFRKKLAEEREAAKKKKK